MVSSLIHRIESCGISTLVTAIRTKLLGYLDGFVWPGSSLGLPILLPCSFIKTAISETMRSDCTFATVSWIVIIAFQAQFVCVVRLIAQVLLCLRKVEKDDLPIQGWEIPSEKRGRARERARMEQADETQKLVSLWNT